MSKGQVIATYSVQVTLREPETGTGAEVTVPTNKKLEVIVEEALEVWTNAEVNATSARTDK